jgi:hypothetical protein
MGTKERVCFLRSEGAEEEEGIDVEEGEEEEVG